MNFTEFVQWVSVSTALSTAYIALLFAADQSSVWLVLGPLMIASVVALHQFTFGRSSPLAAASFVLGLLGGWVGQIGWTFLDSKLQETTPRPDMTTIAFISVNAGVMLACLSAASFAWGTRDEWLPYYSRLPDGGETWPRGMPRCLSEFKLDYKSTVDDLDAAYRARVMEVHPDHGGTAEQFKRLQRNYALAARLLRRAEKRT